MMTDDPGNPYRGMDFGGIIGETLRLYRENFGMFSAAAAMVAVPYALIKLLPAHSPLSGPAMLVVAALYLFAGAMLTAAVAARFRGLPTEFAEVSATARRKFWPLVGATMLTGLAVVCIILAAVLVGMLLTAATNTVAFVFLALLVGYVPIVYLLVRWMFITPVIVLEDSGVFDAFSRSTELTDGGWWRLFGIKLAVAIPLGVVFLIVTSLSVLVLGPLAGGAIGVLISMLLDVPLEITVTTLLYFDRVGRRDGDPLRLAA